MTSSGDLVAQGWTISLTAENGIITSVTTAGTAVDEFFKNGFRFSELTTGEGNEGAISTVILALTQEATLPPDSTQRIALIGVEAVMPDDPGVLTLRYVDDLVGSGVAVDNIVTDQDAISRSPERDSKIVDLVPDTVEPCDEVNPDGWIRTAGWNLLFPLSNPNGCDGGGPSNMLRNWVAPHDLLLEAPVEGEEWGDIDFQGTAASGGFEAGELYAGLGLSGDPVWVTCDLLRNVTEFTLPNRNVVDYEELLDLLNGLVVPGLGIPRIFTDNAVAIAQTYVENTADGAICVDVCTASNDSVQVWVNDTLVTNVSVCRPVSADCSERNPAALAPGINKITVLNWEGTGDWGFKVAIEDPETGIKLSNENQNEIAFLGTGRPDPLPASLQLLVRRSTENPDACPADGLRITLTGNGAGSGTVKITETYNPEVVAADSFTNISDGGALTVVGDVADPEAFRITWNVDASVVNSSGVSYDLELPPNASAEPIGLLNDCTRVGGVSQIQGPREHTGPIGVFDDSHDIGSASELADGPGSLVVASAGDEDIYTVEGSGQDIGDEGDSFHFAYKRVKGGFSATIRVADRVFPPSGGRRSPYGLMARQDCSLNSRYSLIHANLEADPGPGSDHPRGDAVVWQFRRNHRVDATTDASQFFVFPDPDGLGPLLENQPEFFRLDRVGNTFFGYASFDGDDWRLVGANAWDGLGLDVEILVGFVYSKGSSAVSGAISFTGFRLGPPPEAEIFDDDGVVIEEVLQQSDFEGLPDGSLPPEFEVNSSGENGAGPGEGGGGGGFTPRVINGRLRLTEEGIPNSSSSVFLKTPVPIGSGKLIVEYTLYASHSGVTGQPVAGDPDPGEGLTFTLLAGSDTQKRGGAGKDLGYGGITRSFGDATPSLAVEADTWTNENVTEGTGSPDNDGTWHLGVNTGGNVQSVALKSSGLPDLFAPEGVRHRVVITSEGQVSVFLLPSGGDGAGGGAAPLLETKLEPLGDKSDAVGVLGFTAATGTGTQTSEVDDVDVRFVECSDTQETAVIEAPEVAFIGQEIELDGSVSNAGPGDEDENPDLQFEWQIDSGPGRVVGPSDGPTLAFIVGDGDAIARLTVNDGRCSNFASTTRMIQAIEPPRWYTYDANNDGRLDISDPIAHLSFLFLGTEEPRCPEAMDFNGDDQRNISDPVSALTFLFGGGPPPVDGEGCQVHFTCDVGKGCAP